VYPFPLHSHPGPAASDPHPSPSHSGPVPSLPVSQALCDLLFHLQAYLTAPSSRADPAAEDTWARSKPLPGMQSAGQREGTTGVPGEDPGAVGLGSVRETLAGLGPGTSEPQAFRGSAGNGVPFSA